MSGELLVIEPQDATILDIELKAIENYQRGLLQFESDRELVLLGLVALGI